jgi:hypothetical protein
MNGLSDESNDTQTALWFISINDHKILLTYQHMCIDNLYSFKKNIHLRRIDIIYRNTTRF